MHQNHSVLEKSLALLRDNHKYNLLSLLDFNGYTPPPRYHVNTTEMIGRLGHQLEDMLLECRFRGENCTHQNFTTVCKVIWPRDITKDVCVGLLMCVLCTRYL